MDKNGKIFYLLYYYYWLYCTQLSATIMGSVTKTPVLEARNAGTVI